MASLANQHEQLTYVYVIVCIQLKNILMLIWVYTYLLLYVACLSIPQPSLAKCKRLAAISIHELKDCEYNKQNDMTRQDKTKVIIKCKLHAHVPGSNHIQQVQLKSAMLANNVSIKNIFKTNSKWAQCTQTFLHCKVILIIQN